ncbi:coiled-coil domain-containing protein 90B, mitochondrial isoform 2-T2 [Spinachia spinachia]
MNALLRRVTTGTGTWRCFHRTPMMTFDLRKVELTPLEQRKLTFDSHVMVTELQSSGFERRQAELIVSALVTLTTANMDVVYKDMVTKAHQDITVQQIMAHLDSIRKDMVILEKSDFANLRSENTFIEQEKKLMEAGSEFHHKKADLQNDNMDINRNIDLQVASLRTELESLKLQTIRYLAATVFSCLAIALGVYRLWR